MNDRYLTETKLTQAHIDAADWLVTLQSGEITRDEQIAFKAWYVHADNASAYDSLSKTWDKFSPAQADIAQKTLNDALQHDKNSNQTNTKVKNFSLAAITAIGLIYFTQSKNINMLSADHNNIASTTKTIPLDDNSQIRLPPRSAVNINYSKSTRNIELISGTVYIDVATDPIRPLIITSAHGHVTALGTAFSVQVKESNSIVNVIESTVNACAHTKTSSCIKVRSGEYAAIETNSVKKLATTNEAIAIDWQQQKIIVDNQPLTKVITILQQHYPGYIHLDEADFSEMIISGVFSLRNTNESLLLMASILPISVTQFTPHVIRVTRENTKLAQH